MSAISIFEEQKFHALSDDINLPYHRKDLFQY